jgi:hypothetical protein
MLRWARLPQVFLAVITAHICAVAQVAGSADLSNRCSMIDDKQAETRQQAARGLLEQVLAGVKSLSLPQNRIAIEAEAFPLVWSHNEAQARSLVSQMVGEFGQAASQQEQSTDFNSVQQLRAQRQMLVQTIAGSDAQLALEFLTGTRAYVRAGTPEEEDAQERQLRLAVAVQEAARNPRRALEIAEKDLQTSGSLPYELINLLNQVTAGDRQAGTQLFRDVVSEVKNRDLSTNTQDFNFAISLLNTRNNAETDAGEADDSIRALADSIVSSALSPLADSIVSSALSPQFPQNMLFSLNGALATFQRLVPGKVQAIREKLESFQQLLSPDQKTWQKFNEAQATGNTDNLLAVAAQAPPELRVNFYEQVAWKFASDGDLDRVRQIAENIRDPFRRNQMLQQALRQAVWGASNKGNFVLAQQFVGQITPEEERATMLAQLALNTVNAKQPALASEMLAEAVSLLGGHPQTAAQFSAQLQVAQVLIQVKSAGAVQILERAANELEQLLGPALQVDGFLPYQHSFHQGELILNNSFFFNSLIGPYVQATSQLANSDLSTARTLADRLPLPEARLMAELAVARGVLSP